MQSEIRSGLPGLWLRWLVANVVGFTLGGAIGRPDTAGQESSPTLRW